MPLTSHKLENGDRLSRAEFERLSQDEQIERIELIQGIVHMAAAALRFREHGKPSAMMSLWLGQYACECQNVEVAENTSVLLDDQNELQPDILMILPMSCGGQTCVNQDGYLEGPPELVVEIAASLVSIDAHQKKDVYGQSGVREYILWRTEDQQIDWFRLSEHSYRNISQDSDSIIRSTVFPGLWLNTRAMVDGQIKKVLNTLAVGMQSPEHQTFRTHLESRNDK
jgi:Uma2 family endonuclease